MQAASHTPKKLLLVFPELAFVEELNGHLDRLTVTSLNLYKKSMRVEICLSSDVFIPYRIISHMEQSIAAICGVGAVDIHIVYACDITDSDIPEPYWENVLYYVYKKCTLAKAFLSGSKPRLDGGKLYVNLCTAGSDVLYSKGCSKLIEKVMRNQFNRSIRVEFVDPVFGEESEKRYKESKLMSEEKVIKDTVSRNGREKSKQAADTKAAGKDAKQEAVVVLGKAFRDETSDISSLTQESGKVAINGEIVSVDTRDIKGGKTLFIFDLTDFTSTVTVKFFAGRSNAVKFAERLKPGINVRVRGEAQYDRFSKELVIMASDILQVSVEVRKDNSEEKRVELHAHTQMSQMDAVIPPAELIKRAAQWGHEAIAVTDHGVVQAFPDLFDAGKKNNIKVIYGMECYLIDDSMPTDYYTANYPIDGEFVVIDIETTGLDAETDRITEIGAVKINNGEIVDRFESLVNPGVRIPETVVRLTGITDEMVKDAPSVDFVIPRLMEFIGNAVIVAHNSAFDMGFIRHNAGKIGLDINNPVIDTLEISRKMFPGLGKYKLRTVAEHIGLNVENCHRAFDDCTLTAKIFIYCLEKLRNKGIKTVFELQKKIQYTINYNDLESHHAVILVRNQEGLKNLYRVVSISHLEYFYKKPRIPKSILTKYRSGLIIGSACESGELYGALLKGKPAEEVDRIVRFYDYLEVQPAGNNAGQIRRGLVRSVEDLNEITRKIIDLGERHGKPVVATGDVHFLDKQDEVFRRILMAGQGYEDADLQPPLYFKTTEEMLEEFDYLGREKAREIVIKNTRFIADMVEEVTPIPTQTFPPKIDGAEDDIRSLAEGRAKSIYGEPLPGLVKERLERELNSIIKNGFSVMYIIAQRLVSKSLSDGYLVGSRGSVGSSFAATMAGITEVNPLPPHYVCPSCKYSEFVLDGSVGCGVDMPDKNCPKCGAMLRKDGNDIPFETFLGFEGDKEPDIDLNFSGEYQPRAHKYIEELFGADHVYRAGTIATIAEKTAYGFVKNYLESKGKIVTNAEINRLVRGCAGVKRTTGQHPGGLIIVPQDNEIYNFCPIQHPADDTGSDVITTHFDYHSISGRLLKLDILGHDDPTVIRMLEDLTGVNALEIPIGEKTTMGIFSSTEPLGISPEDINSQVGTFGVPEFGTKFVRQILADTKPKTFSELVRISGLSHGTDVWLNNAQDLIRSGTANLSEAICTRDDIMVYLLYKGLEPKTAFKIMEDVRKGKGVKKEYEVAMKEKGVPDWYIESCKKIKYMFPKAHAVAYVIMAFRIAWFKVYHPEAFYVAYFTVRADEFDAGMMTRGRDVIRNKIRELEQNGNDLSQKDRNVLTILEVANEMYARGIKFLPVDLYKSDAVRFLVTPEGIRPPLNTLQGLGEAAARNIVTARENGKFVSIDDLKIRAKVSKSVVEILQQHNCLEGLPESNQISLF